VVQQAATLYRDGLTDGHTATLLEWWAGLPPQEREAYVGSMAVYAARETAKYTGGGPVLRYFCTVLRRCLQHPTDYDERQRAEAEGRPAPAPKRGARQTAIPTKQDGTIDESQLSPIMRGILEQSKEQAAERRAARERAAGAGMKGDTN
jgi:hypothetical protein